MFKKYIKSILPNNIVFHIGKNLNKPGAAMNLLKSAVDGLNHKEFIYPGYQPSYLDENIISVHFYHNLCFVYKGTNKEPSNYLVRNEIP